MIRSFLCFLILLATRAAAQPSSGVPAAGRILVATAKSADPDFAKSVVLLVHSGVEGAIGVLVNRPTEVPLSKVFPSLRMSQPVYFGGPVAMGARALVRSAFARPGLTHLFGDVWTTSDPAVLVKLAETGMKPDVFRVYAGYTGWSPAQLRGEIRAGLWKVIPGNSRVVFPSRPDLLWSVLSR